MTLRWKLLKWKTVNNFCNQTKGPIVRTQRREPGWRKAWQPKYTSYAPVARTLTWFDLETGPQKRTKMKTITEIRLIIHGEGPRCRQRKHYRLSGQKRPQSKVNISSTLTLFERVNSRRVTYMDRLTSPARSSWSNHPWANAHRPTRHLNTCAGWNILLH